MPKEAQRQHAGPLIYLLLAFTLFTLISGAIAIGTVGDCGGWRSSKQWVVIPPHWQCGTTKYTR